MCPHTDHIFLQSSCINNTSGSVSQFRLDTSSKSILNRELGVYILPKYHVFSPPFFCFQNYIFPPSTGKTNKFSLSVTLLG